jgi:hypothetical protein
MTPDEESSLLGGLLSGVGYVAGAIDKPFAATRGTIHGLIDLAQGETPEWGGGLLNVVPFSDTMGLTDRDDRVFGRDILENAGIAPPNKPGFTGHGWGEFGWDAAGLGVDLLASPPLLPGGPAAALGKAGRLMGSTGRAAKAAARSGQPLKTVLKGLTDNAKVVLNAAKPGATQAQIKAAREAGSQLLGTSGHAYVDEIREGLRGLVALRLGWPWNKFLGAKDPVKVFGAGSERAAKVAEAVYFGKWSPVPAFRSVFSHIPRGIGRAATQKAMDISYSAKLNIAAQVTDAYPHIAKAIRGAEATFGEFAKFAKVGGDEVGATSFDRMMTMAAEMKSATEGARNLSGAEIAELIQTPGQGPLVRGQVDEVAKTLSDVFDHSLRNIGDEMHALMNDYGMDVKTFGDLYREYLPSRLHNVTDKERVFEEVSTRLFNPTFSHAISREPTFRGVPGGRINVGDMAGSYWITRPADRIPPKLAKYTDGGFRKEWTRPVKDGKDVTESLLVGQLVEALDRGAMGRIVGFAKDSDTALVAFAGPKGKISRVPLALKSLKAVAGDAPANANLPIGPLLPKQIQSISMRGWLDEAGHAVADDASHELITREFIYRYFLEPAALAEMAPRGALPEAGKMVTAMGRLAGIEGRRKMAVFQELAQQQGTTADELLDLVTQAGHTPEEAIAKAARWELDRLHKGAKEWLEPVIENGVQKLDDAGEPLFHTIAPAAESKAAELAKYFTSQSPRPDGMWTNTWAQDWLMYVGAAAESLSNIFTIHRMMGGFSKLSGRLTKGGTHPAGLAGHLPLAEAWNTPVWKGRPALNERGLLTMMKNWVKDPKNAKELGEHGQGLAAAGVDDLSTLSDDALKELATELYVPAESKKALQTYVNTMHPTSAESSVVGQAYDIFTNLARVMWTTPHPAFHVRNWVSGTYQNLTGEVPYSVKALGQAMKETNAFLHGKAKLPAEFADEILATELLSHGRLQDIIGRAAGETVGLPEGGIGHAVDALLHPRQHSLNPLAVRGVSPGVGGPGGGPQFALAEFGDRMYKAVEAMNRIPPYMAARRAGMTPSQAKQLVDKLQYNYARLSPHESKLFRRFVFPFYGWLKNNSLYQISNIGNFPGGKNATAIRMLQAVSREAGGYVPSWLKQSTSFPWGGVDEDGQATVLHSLGLPFSGELGLVEGPENLGRMVKNIASSGNPIWANLLARMFGEDIHTGRPLKDLPLNSLDTNLMPSTGDPVTDYTLRRLNPFSRFFSEARKLKEVGQAVRDVYTGEETAPKPLGAALLNAFTGAKFKDLDAQIERLRDRKRAIERQLKESPYVRELGIQYVPERFEGKTPEDLDRQIALLESIRQQLTAARIAEEAATKGQTNVR